MFLSCLEKVWTYLETFLHLEKIPNKFGKCSKYLEIVLNMFGNFSVFWKNFPNKFGIFSEHLEIIPNGFGNFSKLLEKFEIDLEMFLC